MDYITLRDVANREIYDSFRGILRISPNGSDKEDDTTSLLKTLESEIKLSDSEGNYMGITFIPKKLLMTVKYGNPEDGIIEKEANIINVAQKCPNLYIVKNLNINKILYISQPPPASAASQKAPIQIISKNGVLLFPIDAPEDDRYINHNNKEKLSINNNPTSEEVESVFDNLPANHKFYTSAYENYHVKINGKKILKPAAQDGTLVPELYTNDYILGQCKGDTYSVTGQNQVDRMNDVNGDANKHITNVSQLSFINLDKMIWESLEGSTKNSFRSYKGRYKNLLPKNGNNNTVNDLFVSLFGNITSTLEEKIKSKAPLVGLPVQTGSIIYNAMPLRRYLFHMLRYYDKTSLTNSTSSGSSSLITQSTPATKTIVGNLITEFVLCDGKRIKYINGSSSGTDYPHINKDSSSWKNWTGKNGTSKSIYDAMCASMSTSTTILKSPPLFEFNQLSLRYLRGLNWVRTCNNNSKGYYFDNRRDIVESDGTFASQTLLNPISGASGSLSSPSYTFSNNRFKYIIDGLSKTNSANIVKDICKVGMYYTSYDYKIRNTHRHVHQILADKDKLVDGDTLYQTYPFYYGETYNTDGDIIYDPDGLPTNQYNWKNYVNLGATTFNGTYVMRSIQKINGITDKTLIRNIQDLPVAIKGGTTSLYRKTRGSYQAGQDTIMGCHNHKHHPRWAAICDGGYGLAPVNSTISNQIWRLISSLPIKNKYGAYNDKFDNTTYSKVYYENTTINIDDNLPYPPSINLIPLIKI